MHTTKNQHKLNDMIIGFIGPEVLVTSLLAKIIVYSVWAVLSLGAAFFFLLVFNDIRYGFDLSLSDFGSQGLTAFYFTMPWVAMGLMIAFFVGAYVASGLVRKILATKHELPHKNQLVIHLSILVAAVLSLGLFLGGSGLYKNLASISFINNLKSYERFDDERLIIGIVQQITTEHIVIVDKDAVTYDVQITPDVYEALVNGGVVIGSTVKVLTDNRLADLKAISRDELAADLPVAFAGDIDSIDGYGDKVDTAGDKVVFVASPIAISIVPEEGSQQQEITIVIIPEQSPNYYPPPEAQPAPTPPPSEDPTPVPSTPIIPSGWNQVAAYGLPSSVTNQRDITTAIAHAATRSNASVVRLDLSGEWYLGDDYATSSKPITVIIDLRDASVNGLRPKRANEPGMAHELIPKTDVAMITHDNNVKLVFVGNKTAWKNARTYVYSDATFYGFVFSFRYDTWARIQHWPKTGSINGSTYPGSVRMAKSVSDPRIFDLKEERRPAKLVVVNSVFKDYIGGISNQHQVEVYGTTFEAPYDNGFNRAGGWTWALFKGTHQPYWWDTYLREGQNWQDGERGFINKGAKERNLKNEWMGSDPGDITHSTAMSTGKSGTTKLYGVTFYAASSKAEVDRSNKAMPAYPRKFYHTTKLILNNVDVYGGGWDKSIFSMSQEGGGGNIRITINGRFNVTTPVMHRSLEHFSKPYNIKPGYRDSGLIVDGNGTVSNSIPATDAATIWRQTSGKNITGLDSLLQAIN